MQRYNFFDISELGKVTQSTQYAVYNRTRQELVHRRGVCYAGLPQFWYNTYNQAEELLNEALKYFPDNEILTIIKKDSVFTFTDCLPEDKHDGHQENCAENSDNP